MKSEQQYLSSLLKQLQDPLQEDQQRLRFQKQTLHAGLAAIVVIICLIWAQQSSWIIALVSLLSGVILMLAGSLKNTLNNQQILRQYLDIKTIEERLMVLDKKTNKSD